MSLILNGTDGLSDVDGSAATPAIRGTDTNTGIFFPAADTIAFSEGGTEAMRIDGSGQVGIGTSSPAQKLDVAGDITFGSSNKFTSSANQLAGATGQNGILIRSAVSSASNPSYSNVDDSNTGMFFPAADTLGFTNGGTERMRIDSGGNLLVGTTSGFASAKVSVLTGSDGFRTQIGNGSAGFIVGNTSGTGSYNAHLFYNNNFSSLVGYIVINGTTASYVSVSDYRLKEDIVPMTSALAKVSALKPVTYKWKSDGSNGQGFIAHELQAVVPDCVTGEKDAVDDEGKPVYQGIDTSFLVATLTAAIQELKAELDTVKAELATLKA